MNESERRFSTGSATSCPSPPQRPWLNERVLRAFDEPPPPEPLSMPNYGVYQPPGSTNFCPVDHIQNPDAAVEQVLQTLGSAIEAEANTRTSQMPNTHFAGVGAQPTPGQPDFLSPEARAQLQLFSEPEEISPEDCWAPPPALPPPPPPTVSHDPTMTNFSTSSSGSSVPSFPSPGHVSPLNTCYSCSHPYPDPSFAVPVEDEHLLDSLFARPPAPLPEPQTRPTRPVPQRQQTPKKPGRTFKFVLEDIGGQAPIIQ